jgi:hypothetical protein
MFAQILPAKQLETFPTPLSREFNGKSLRFGLIY